MKYCHSCQTSYTAKDFICPGCAKETKVLDGVYVHSPQLAQENDGFDSSLFEKLIIEESNNFWFKARNEIIVWFLNHYVGEGKKNSGSLGKYLEIGCGSGFVLQAVFDNFKKSKIYGSEIFLNGLLFAKARTQDAVFMQMDAREIPYVKEFNVIGAYDVLEHIEEDSRVIKEIYNALQDNGIFISTVPQHKRLWSFADDIACHKRRYEPGELEAKLRESGFKIVRSTSFVTLLLPFMYISRIKRNKDQSIKSKDFLRIPKILNKIFSTVMKVELLFIKLGFNFPFGGSRLVIAIKMSDNNEVS